MINFVFWLLSLLIFRLKLVSNLIRALTIFNQIFYGYLYIFKNRDKTNNREINNLNKNQMQAKTKKSIQEPIETKFLINIGDVTITPENINLVPQQYLNEYTYIFKVVCINKFGVMFKVNIVASYTDEKWTLLKLDNYVVYENNYYAEIHTAIHNQIIPRLSMFDNIFVRDYLTLKQDLFFNGDLVTFKTVRKTAKGCYVRINVGDKIRNANRLYATFIIDKNDINNPKFVLDAFEYDSINYNVVDFIETHGTIFHEFINININYIRIM